VVLADTLRGPIARRAPRIFVVCLRIFGGVEGGGPHFLFFGGGGGGGLTSSLCQLCLILNLCYRNHTLNVATCNIRLCITAFMYM